MVCLSCFSKVTSTEQVLSIYDLENGPLNKMVATVESKIESLENEEKKSFYSQKIQEMILKYETEYSFAAFEVSQEVAEKMIANHQKWNQQIDYLINEYNYYTQDFIRSTNFEELKEVEVNSLRQKACEEFNERTGLVDRSLTNTLDTHYETRPKELERLRKIGSQMVYQNLFQYTCKKLSDDTMKLMRDFSQDREMLILWSLHTNYMDFRAVLSKIYSSI